MFAANPAPSPDFFDTAMAFVASLPPSQLLWAIPATLLAAVLERPFVSRAGVQRRPSVYSLQANLLSSLICFVALSTVPVRSSAARPTAGTAAAAVIFVTIVSVAVLSASEGGYYESVSATDESPLRWRWVLLGNVFSTFVLFCTAAAGIFVASRYPEWRIAILPYSACFKGLGDRSGRSRFRGWLHVAYRSRPEIYSGPHRCEPIGEPRRKRILALAHFGTEAIV